MSNGNYDLRHLPPEVRRQIRSSVHILDAFDLHRRKVLQVSRGDTFHYGTSNSLLIEQAGFLSTDDRVWHEDTGSFWPSLRLKAITPAGRTSQDKTDPASARRSLGHAVFFSDHINILNHVCVSILWQVANAPVGPWSFVPVILSVHDTPQPGLSGPQVLSNSPED